VTGNGSMEGVDPNSFANATQSCVPHLENGIVVMLYARSGQATVTIHNPHETATGLEKHIASNSRIKLESSEQFSHELGKTRRVEPCHRSANQSKRN